MPNETLEEVRHGHGREVGQLAGIEERAATGTALLEPDMCLLGVDQSIHRAGAARASIVFDFVLLFTRLCVADVEHGRRFLRAQLAEFAAVEPQSVTG